MRNLHANARTVIAELDQTVARVDQDQFDQVAGVLDGTSRGLVLGVGREGLAARAFAMRLVHLGLTVHGGWGDTTPNVTADDVFVVVNGSVAIGQVYRRSDRGAHRRTQRRGARCPGEGLPRREGSGALDPTDGGSLFELAPPWCCSTCSWPCWPSAET